MKTAVLLLVATLSAIPALAFDDSERFVMVIDAGRLGVMMDQSEQILKMKAETADGSTDTFAVLKSAVRDYQRVLPVACAMHRVGPALCEAALYDPSWLSEAGEPAPETLRARIDEATGHVAPLWNALCAGLPKDHDPSLCQIE